MKEYTIPVTTRTEARISAADATALAIRLICEQFGIPEDAFIDDAQDLCRAVEVRTSHSSWETKVIRPATDADKAALLVIAKLLLQK